MRCFIAIELNDQIKQKLIEAQQLFKNIEGKINFVKREQMHLTIKFLGYVPENRISVVSDTLSSTIKENKIKQFELTVEGLGAFPSVQRPKVLWAAIKITDKIKQLHKIIDESLNRIEIPSDEREYTPHLTLARIKSKIDNKLCQQIIEQNKNFIVGSQYVEKITLFASELKPTGAIYTPLSTIILSSQ